MSGRKKLILASFAIAGGVCTTVLVGANRSPGYKMPEKIRLLPLKHHVNKYRRPNGPVPFPAYNPYTEEKYQLGKKLFFDKRLSGANDMSCATCHQPNRQWTDGLPLAKGFGGKTLKRRTPSLWNVAWGTHFFWDGRADTLEKQALGPITSEDEMNQPLDELVAELSADEEYRRLFSRVFPRDPQPISPENVAKAIATFERGIVTGRAPFDRWVDGEENAISDAAKRGFVLFNDKANCYLCHAGWNFTNQTLMDIGLPTDDLGRVFSEKISVRQFRFKAPSLRNVTRRTPYMHNGVYKTLEEVLDNYNRGGTVRRPSLSEFVDPLFLTQEEMRDLISFLQTLESEDFVH